MAKSDAFEFDENEERVAIERTKEFGENLKKNFPKAFATCRDIPFTYSAPKSYLETAYWEQITSKLGEWRRNWLEYQRRLVMVQDENILPKQLDLARKTLEKLTDSYDLLMQMDCGEKGHDSKIPVELWNDLWEELRDMDTRTRDLCSCLSAELTVHLKFVTFNWPHREKQKTITEERVNVKQEALSAMEDIKKKLESMRHVGSVHETIVDNIIGIWYMVTKISADTEDQEDMFGVLVGILEKNKVITPKEYKEIREGIEELIVECSAMTDTSSYQHLPERFGELFVPKVAPRKEIKKEPQEPDLDVSRARTRRDRKPKKVYSPLYTPPPELVEDDQPVATSSESDNDSGSEFEAYTHADLESDDQEEFIVEDEDEPPKKRHKGPDNQSDSTATEAEAMVLEQTLYLEETKLHLLGCRLPNGKWAVSYLPVLLELIDKATGALERKENPVHFVMYRAAVEEGVARFIEETRVT